MSDGPSTASRAVAARTSARAADLALRVAAQLGPDDAAAALLTVAAHGLNASGPGADDAPAGTRDPFVRLADALRLSPFERDVLVLAGLAHEHEAAAAAFRLLHPRHEPAPTVGLAARVLCIHASERPRLLRALGDGALGAIVMPTGSAPGPWSERSLTVAADLWLALSGFDAWPTGVEPVPAPGAAGLERWLLTPAVAAGVAACRDGGARVVLLSGADVDDSASRALAMVRAAGLAGVLFDAAMIEGNTASDVSHHCLARAVVPVLITRATSGLDDGLRAPVTLDRHPGPVVVCAPHGAEVAAGARPIVSVPIPPLDLDDRVELWRALLPDCHHDAARLAALYLIEPHRAEQAVRDLHSLAALTGNPVDVGNVGASIRRRAGLTLPASVRLIEPEASWERLVLPDDHVDKLHAAVARSRHQHTVRHRWGFERSKAGAGGVRLLFAGPPGTGKTLAAEVVARDLGLELLVVDLAALVSKWLGETEKNLALVFDTAERAQAVLLFDEADALFGKRTDINDAHSRWANLETAYLLGRLERFEGIVVLATNLRSNLDAAFVRRLEFVLEFDEPDRAALERLWTTHLSKDAPLAPDVDVPELAELYPIVGGVVRNAAVAAAYLAAADGGAIHQHHLICAIRREYEKAGRSFPGTPRHRTVRAQGQETTWSAL